MKAIDNIKERLLETAKDVIREQGIADFNIRTIAKKAGVAIGTVYNHYPSKSDLVVATMQNFISECCSALGKEASSDLYQEFRSVYFSIYRYFHLFQGDIMNDLASLASSKEQPRSAVEHQHMMILKDSFAGILTRHQQEINPEILTIYGINSVIEMILTIFTANLRKSPQRYDLIDFFLHRLLGK